MQDQPSPDARILKELAKHLHDLEHGRDYTWPDHEGDDGYRGTSGYVRIAPPSIQCLCRTSAQRILTTVRSLDARFGRRPSDRTVGQSSDVDVAAALSLLDALDRNSRPDARQTLDPIIVGSQARLVTEVIGKLGARSISVTDKQTGSDDEKAYFPQDFKGAQLLGWISGYYGPKLPNGFHDTIHELAGDWFDQIDLLSEAAVKVCSDLAADHCRRAEDCTTDDGARLEISRAVALEEARDRIVALAAQARGEVGTESVGAAVTAATAYAPK